MANTSALYVRIDTEVKEKAESILTQLWHFSNKRHSNVLQPDLFVKTVFL